MPVRILLPAALLLAVLAFVVAGCGGGQSAEEKWADDVCTPVQNWQTQINQLVDDAKAAVSSPDASTISTLKTDAQKAVSATDKLRSDLRDLPPAPGENGQTARETVTSFANQMSQTVSALKSSVSKLSSSTSASQAASVLSGAAGQISTLTTQAKSAVNSVEQLSSKLKSGFEDADSCKDLRS
jgi:nitrate/nitrite-specific signal transduction histidine kinase